MLLRISEKKGRISIFCSFRYCHESVSCYPRTWKLQFKQLPSGLLLGNLDKIAWIRLHEAEFSGSLSCNKCETIGFQLGTSKVNLNSRRKLTKVWNKWNHHWQNETLQPRAVSWIKQEQLHSLFLYGGSYWKLWAVGTQDISDTTISSSRHSVPWKWAQEMVACFPQGSFKGLLVELVWLEEKGAAVSVVYTHAYDSLFPVARSHLSWATCCKSLIYALPNFVICSYALTQCKLPSLLP